MDGVDEFWSCFGVCVGIVGCCMSFILIVMDVWYL